MRIFEVVCLSFAAFLFAGCGGSARPETPIMGWSSWNSYRININEELIKAQADSMVSSGMADAGYEYVNIDDGYFGGRDEDGKLFSHPEKFPNGMKAVADYIHSKGLKAGIYSDAGKDTCASKWDNDPKGYGVGLYGHTEQDLRLMLEEWGYDFMKVDWCGGEWLGLDEPSRYTEIGETIRSIREDVVYNVCRWQFPGEWFIDVADSWRISGDIQADFGSITRIIDLNADLWKYAGPGHVNDMDMLQVGRGMSYEEDKAHFSMWCMMASPLLAGNDLRSMTEETVEILTNAEMIAINQDPLVYQARRLRDDGEYELWARPLGAVDSGVVAVALLNRSKAEAVIGFEPAEVGLADTGYTVRDVWAHKFIKVDDESGLEFAVPAHGVVVLTLKGKAAEDNPFSPDERI
ncbi:Alpha-galactosidase A precursor [Anaerohalosphaera lusitana]|uniref:Alpha-galactosidase n=1 Tax=Anaerohalosphaera lusitana TaxID=1936003 RepID=A0A1U9NMY9_9BACT|nr:glycoside hydrolase family 27 protein [Anaerohalosphaera lusitana]AQT68970.1 Alpha-galactosidase A precursor [Anaerohalosphaera lusitana]